MPRIFSLEKDVSRNIASCSAGEVPEVSLPDDFPDDPLWQSWPEHLYRAVFEPGCPVDPCQGARRTAAFLKGLAENLNRELLLPHLKHRHRARRQAEKGEAPVLQLLFSMLQQDCRSDWIPVREFISRATEAEELKHYLDPDYAADYVYFETRGYYRNFLGDSGIHEEQRYLETPELYREACLLPLVQNYLGAATFLGILELHYGKSESPYTPWAGITKFRLSGWGEFVTGREMEVPVWKPGRVLDFSSTGEIVRLRESSPEARKLLLRIASEIAPGVFRLGRGQIVAAAESEEQLNRIVDSLLEMAIEPVPEFWQKLFESMNDSVVRLEEASEYLIFRIPEHGRLSSVLREDPALTRLIIPAAGRKILIRKSDLSRLHRELKKRGLLLELP